MADAGYRLTVEGEAEFKRALADINAQVKLNKSEINALTAEYNANGGSLETLQAKQAALGKEMAAQQQKIDTMREHLEAAKDAYGENSAQVMKLQTDLNNASGALSAMQKQYNDTTKQIEDATHSTASYDEAVKQAEAAVAAEKAELDNLAAAYEGTGTKARNLTANEKDLTDQSGVLADRQENLAAQQKSLTAQIEAQQKKIDALNGAMKTAADRYGAGSTEAQKYREQIAKAEGELGKMKTSLDKTTKAMEDQSGASGGLLDGLKGLTDQFGVQLPGSMDKLLEGFGSLAGPAGAAGLLAALGEVAEKLKEVGDAAAAEASELTDLSTKTGASTSELEALHYVCGLLDVDTGSLDKAMEGLNKKMLEAKDKSGEARDMFDRMGVAVVDQEGKMRSTADVFLDVVDGLKQYEYGAERAAAAEKLMGGSANDLTSLLAESGERVRGYMKEAMDNLGLMTDDMIAELDRQEKAAARTETAWHNLWRAVGASGRLTSTYDPSVKIESGANARKALGNWLSQFWSQITRQYARGTSYHPGGLALVGEQGPEIVDLPRGSAVYPTGTAPAGTTNNYYDVKIDASRIRELNDIVRIAENERVSRRMGVAK